MSGKFKEFFSGIPFHCNVPMIFVRRFTVGKRNFTKYKCQKCPCTRNIKE